jgi:hypothetical protein
MRRRVVRAALCARLMHADWWHAPPLPYAFPSHATPRTSPPPPLRRSIPLILTVSVHVCVSMRSSQDSSSFTGTFHMALVGAVPGEDSSLGDAHTHVSRSSHGRSVLVYSFPVVLAHFGGLTSCTTTKVPRSRCLHTDTRTRTHTHTHTHTHARTHTHTRAHTRAHTLIHARVWALASIVSL